MNNILNKDREIPKEGRFCNCRKGKYSQFSVQIEVPILKVIDWFLWGYPVLENWIQE